MYRFTYTHGRNAPAVCILWLRAVCADVCPDDNDIVYVAMMIFHLHSLWLNLSRRTETTATECQRKSRRTTNIALFMHTMVWYKYIYTEAPEQYRVWQSRVNCGVLLLFKYLHETYVRLDSRRTSPQE